MRWIRILIVCCIALLSVSCTRGSGKASPVVVDGVLNTTGWDFEQDGPISLRGEWEVELEGSLEKNGIPRSQDFIQVPWSSFSRKTRNGRVLDSSRWARLSLQIVAAQRPLILDLDGRPLADAYFVRCDSLDGQRDEFNAGIQNPLEPWNSNPLRTSGSVILWGTARCTILVGNTGRGIQLYNSARLLSPRDVGLWSTGTALGATAIVSAVCCLFALLLVTLDRRDPVPRWSALYLASWTMRLALAAKPSYLPGSIIRVSSDWVWFRIEYLFLWIALFAMVRYGESLASRRIPGSRGVSIVTLLLVLSAALLPLETNFRLLPVGQLVFMIFGGAMMWALFQKSKRSRSTLVALIGLLVVFTGGVAFSITSARGGRILPLFESMMASEPVFQMIVLCLRTAEARSRAEQLSSATTRFVPREFLQALGHDDLTSARLGDAITREITVLFADIRNFTTISEKLSPEQTFLFLNNCLSRIGPHIRSNHGFVDKYIGDAIMALFPKSPADAVRAALAMQAEIQEYNREQSATVPLSLGLGIHVGQVMMGTIGEEQRFEATVISDAVNLTSRIETLTKQLGCNILVTAEVARHLSSSEFRYTRTLGTFAVKGKSKPIEIVEIFECDNEELRDKKNASLAPFANALMHYSQGNVKEAVKIVSSLAAGAPNDGPMAWWLARLQKDIAIAGMLDWSGGVVKLDEK